MAWGVEARVPFLDREFLDLAMNTDPALKVCGGLAPEGKQKMEKHFLRAAFDTPDDPYLSDEILWRQKEQFSDGVGCVEEEERRRRETEKREREVILCVVGYE